MTTHFFHLTTSDFISGSLIANIINQMDSIQCQPYETDILTKKCLTQTAIDETILSLDNLMQFHKNDKKSIAAFTQRYSSFELQYKTISEKTAIPFQKAHLILDPTLRLIFILHQWKKTITDPTTLLNTIEKNLAVLTKRKHPIANLYQFNYYLAQVTQQANKDKINLEHTENKIFLYALAKVLAYDSADLATPGKKFLFTKLLDDFSPLSEFISKKGNNKAAHLIASPTILSEAKEQKEIIRQSIKLTDWQNKLISFFINQKLRGVYYPHIDKPLIAFYNELGVIENTQPSIARTYKKLLSLHLNSNRPAQLSALFDNLEETVDTLSDIEVIVNVNEDDKYIQSLLKDEIKTRQFDIKYVTSPKPNSFCDLWQPINKLLTKTTPETYFLLNISDEMLFATKGWDTVLKKYVGFFPDHLFRLRLSRNKLRNYFDRWECSFAQDSIPITTKRWVDIGGDWNPCFGPDSFQQLVAFYLAKEGQFSNEHYLREIPVFDIAFIGDTPFIGIDPNKAWKHNQDHIKAMQICQSYRFQLEARRRAILLKANIYAGANSQNYYRIADDNRKKKIHLISKNDNQTLATFSYQVPRFSIFLTNQIRKLSFFEHFGDGLSARANLTRKRNPFTSFLKYLAARHYAFRQTYKITQKIRGLSIRMIVGKLLSLKNSSIKMNMLSQLKNQYELLLLEHEKLEKMLIQSANSPETVRMNTDEAN